MEGWKRELEKMKRLSVRGRVSYVWEYYKVYFLLPLLIVCVIVGVYYSLHSGEAEIRLYGAVINAGLEVERLDGLAEELARELELDENQKVVVDGSYTLATDGMDTNYTMMDRAKLSTYIMGREMDFVVLPEQLAREYCSLDAFYDLDQLVDVDVLQQVDKQYQGMTKEGNDSFCGMYVSETAWLDEFPELADYVICIPKTTEHSEDVKVILKQIILGGA